ncbi:MAG: cell division protein FtsZ [Deltaproteobacteria bacterium]|nr:cell division protein FtsZ [Deltaproteobacteria bacterium]
MDFELVEENIPKAKIRVIGVGGGGGNAVNNMIMSGMTGVEFVVVNTDSQDLARSIAPRRFQLGTQLTRGLGAGARPEVGREAALEDRDRLAELVHGCDMVFITAGMGGGTGTGAAPVIAQVAKEVGALTVAVVTRPFQFEGARRKAQSEEGIENLRQCVDTLITIPNQRLISIATERTTLKEAFAMADRVLYQAVKGVSDLINFQGMINVDFADVRTIMHNKGVALMGVGIGSGERRMLEAAQNAINSPLLDDISLAGSTSVLVNITGGNDLTMHEVSEASIMIQEEAHEDANVIWGWVVDEDAEDDVRVTVIATGFEESYLNQRKSAPARSPWSTGGGGNSRSNPGGNPGRGGAKIQPPRSDYGGTQSRPRNPFAPRKGSAERSEDNSYDVPPAGNRKKRY